MTDVTVAPVLEDQPIPPAPAPGALRPDIDALEALRKEVTLLTLETMKLMPVGTEGCALQALGFALGDVAGLFFTSNAQALVQDAASKAVASASLQVVQPEEQLLAKREAALEIVDSRLADKAGRRKLLLPAHVRGH